MNEGTKKRILHNSHSNPEALQAQCLRGQTVLIISIYLITLWTKRITTGTFVRWVSGENILMRTDFSFRIVCRLNSYVKKMKIPLKLVFSKLCITEFYSLCSGLDEIEFGNWRSFNFLHHFFNITFALTSIVTKLNEMQFNFHNLQSVWRFSKFN